MVDTMRTQPARGSAERQARLWSRAASDWSERTEVLMHALYGAVLDRLGVGNGVSMLDVGCGAGVAASIAVSRGTSVSGLDATPALIALARERAPAAEFQVGEMEQLPYPDGTFDVVTSFNAFQYAAEPVNALAEARRVTRPGGRVAMVTWGRPDRVQMAAVMRAVGALLPPPPPGAPGPFALSEPGALADLARRAGLEPREEGSHLDRWELASLADAVRTTTSAGVMTPAIDLVGEDRVRAAVGAALAPFQTANGSVALHNEFVFLIAEA